MSTAPLIHRFRRSALCVWPETRYCETRFHDGTRAGATRDSTMQNLDYARHLGYRDTWPALLEHELGHTLVSERLGFAVSPTLWAVAHDYASGTAPYEEQLYEEAAVLALQRYLNTGEVLSILKHPDLADFPRWAAELRETALPLLQRTPEAA